MRLARLLLQAYGPFTDKELDFGGVADFHLVYGPNEAGKSSALRAMTDLRFGIPQRSPDNFVHSYGQLRIAAVVVDTQGGRIGLVRHKGRGATLSRFDPDMGATTATWEVGRDLELALTGGLDREAFEAMFGLSHARLRAGGDRLLKGEGELGSALFEASAGTRGIAAILAGLEADAKALFNPHGRAQSAVINGARRELEEQRGLWRQAQTRPATWQALNRAHEQARDDLAEIDRNLEGLRRRENELTELRTVEPLLREHDRAAVELNGLADVPDLPESAREQRLAAEQALVHARSDLEEAERELARTTQALDALVIEEPLIEHAEAIERLVRDRDAAARSRVESARLGVTVERLETELADKAARIASGGSVETLLKSVPSAADRLALDTHLAEIGRLAERLDGYLERAHGLDQGEPEDIAPERAPPDPRARQRLQVALGDAQALGDLESRVLDLDQARDELGARLDQALSDLGMASLGALRNARPLLASQIEEPRKALRDSDDQLGKLGDEDRLVARDLDAQRLRRRQLAAQGEVVTAETLRLARERRDRGWALIRQVYVEQSGSAEALRLEFDAARPLPEAFEAAQIDADRQADLLRADAARAAGYEECVDRILEMEARRRAIAETSAGLSAERDKRMADWSKCLAEACLPDLTPEALREWQAAREGVLELAARLERARADRDRLSGAMADAVSGLSAALQGLDQTLQSSALPALIEQASRWERAATAAEAERAARARAEQSRRTERAALQVSIAQTQAELQAHRTAVEAWHKRLFLPLDTKPEVVKARLDELEGLTRLAGSLAEARYGLAQQQALVAEFEAQASRVAALLGEPPPPLADDLADRLHRRLAASRETAQQGTALLDLRERARASRRLADAEQARQSQHLADLCAAAGVNAPGELPAREESAACKRRLRHRLDGQRQQLAQASVRSENELRACLADQDRIAMDAELSRCREEIRRLEQVQQTARQAEEQARRALESIDTSDHAAAAREAMESAAARYCAAIRPWARLRLAHALLREALSRFRERAQAPMVVAASRYFSLISGGRYPRLVADEEGEQPVLRAEREEGVRIGVKAMSEGTADQLYLALRLAALELRRASHPQMPLVLDDALITSDDQRVSNTLRALASFAEGGQVMLFTHHRHLIELAHNALRERELVVHSL